MKRTDRIEVLLSALSYIAASGSARVQDLVEMTGYSRTAMFRLLRMAKAELDVDIEAVRGRGYVIRDWGLLNGKAVLKRHGGAVKEWIEKRSSRKSESV